MKNNGSFQKLFYLKKQHFLITIMGMLLFSFSYTYGQEKDSLIDLAQKNDSIIIAHKGGDEKYLEDQFYVGLTYNLLNKSPEGVSQSGFSGGLHLGYIRDIPLNRRRNFGIGIGIGWSLNSYRNNLLISETENNKPLFQVLTPDDFDYKLNKFGTQLVEIPFQLRWRTSHNDSYKFWRVYGGVRLGYMYYFHSVFKQPGRKIEKTDIDGLNRLRYGLTFSFGYNTFNFMVYYALNPIFEGSTVDGARVEVSTFKIGLEFYLL